MTWNVVTQTMTETLVRLGFKKRANEIFTSEPSQGYLGWLGLNRANPRPGVFELNPVIGVRSQEVERLVAELLQEKFHAYIPPTISISLGYLGSEPHYKAWLFGELSTLPTTAASLADEIRSLAFPFYTRYASLETIRLALSSGRFGIPEQNVVRLAVVNLLLGNSAEAISVADKQVAELANRGDLAANRQRRFFTQIRRRFAS